MNENVMEILNRVNAKRTARSSRQRAPAETDTEAATLDQIVKRFLKLITEDPAAIDNPELLGQFLTLAEREVRIPYHEVVKHLLRELAACENGKSKLAKELDVANELLAKAESILGELEKRPVGAFVLSQPYEYSRMDGTSVFAVNAVMLGETTERILRIADIGEVQNEESALLSVRDLPKDLPYLAVAERSTGTLLGAAPHIPAPVLTTVRRAVAVQVDDVIARVRIEDSGGRVRDVAATIELGNRIRTALDEGETVHVTIPEGDAVALDIDKTTKPDCPYVQTLPLDAPTLYDGFVMSRPIWDMARRDLAKAKSGKKAVVRCHVGPTGCGKTELSTRFGPTVLRDLGTDHRYKGVKLFRLEHRYISTRYAHDTAGTLQSAVDQAIQLKHRTGDYYPVILLDEGDSIAGESTSQEEQHYVQEERLAVQQIFGDKEFLAAGIPVFMTMNRRRHAFLATAIESRFRTFEWPRPSRAMLAAIGAVYAAQHPEGLARLGQTAQQLGHLLADYVCSEDRTVGKLHFHSGREELVRMRDLVTLGGRTVEELITDFLEGIETETEAADLAVLYQMADTRLTSAQLHEAGIWEQIWLNPPLHDDVKRIERSDNAQR